jgi:pyrroloquinoline quinone (PQQ) biosynthesis protein C
MHHATEEVGHEKWAQSDLQVLGISADEIMQSRPTPSCSAMIGTEYYWAVHDNPVALIGWMYTLEGFGDDIGHLVASQIAKQLPSGQGGTYFLHSHGDADHEHIRDITKVISQDVAEKDLDDVFHVADLSCRFYLGMLSEAAEEVLQH